MHSNQVSFLHFLGHVFIRSDWPNCRRGAPLLPRNHWPKIGVTQWPWVIRRYRKIRQRITCTRGRLTSVLTSVQPRQVWCAIVHLWLSTGTGSGYTFLNLFLILLPRCIHCCPIVTRVTYINRRLQAQYIARQYFEKKRVHGRTTCVWSWN